MMHRGAEYAEAAVLRAGYFGGESRLAIAGWSLQSWALIELGIVMAVAGGTRFVRARRRGRTCERAGDPDRVDAVAHPTVDGTDATDEAGMEHR